MLGATSVCIYPIYNVRLTNFYLVLDRIWFGNLALYALKRNMRFSAMQLTDFF